MHKIASTIGGSVAEVQERLSIKEINDWIKYFEFQENNYQKQEHYFAAILGQLKMLNGFEVDAPYCYFPPNEELAKILKQKTTQKMYSGDEAANILAKAWNNPN